jgi:tetratricopeptide (TPR) repeat protein
LFAKYGIAALVNLPITEDIFAHITPGARGTRLALVEAAQLQGHREDANTHLHQLLALDASDPVVLVSFAELSLDSPHDRPLMDKVVRLTTDINNDTPVHTAVLFYRARALSALGLADAAIQVLTQANRRQKDRPAALMQQIRYHRAELYEQTGRRADARREFEKLYADDPAFEDVASKVLL